MPDHKRTGCRSRGCLIPLGLVSLFIAAFVGRELYLALTATPGSAVNYHALAEELVASYQPPEGENGWNLLLQAIDRMQAFEEQHEDPGYYSNGYLHLLRPADWNEEEYGVSREELTAAGMEGLAGLREAGVWNLLDQLSRSPRIVRSLPNQGVLLDVLLPEVGQARSLALPLGARIAVSHDAGNDADAAAAFVQGCGLARALMYQFTLIDHLVGIAIFSLVSEQLRYALVERSMDEQSLVIIAEALDRLALAPPQLPFEGERLFMLETIQWMHTDDGHGDGRLILARVGGLQSFTGNARARGSPLLNLASIAYPSKEQTTEQAERFYAAVIEAVQKPRQNRGAIQFNMGAWLDQLPKRQILIRLLVPAIGSALEARDLFDAMLAGSRTMVAIELHNARRGSYPDSLDDLVPEFLTTLPADPFAPHGRFIYRRIDPAADPYGRSYILYSVGHDGTDNGGASDAHESAGAFRENATAIDYVFNLPRPSPDDGD